MEIISRAQARALGLRYYFIEPCKHGHVSQRLVCNNACVSCRAVQIKRWRMDNPDKVKAYSIREDVRQAANASCRKRYPKFRAKQIAKAMAWQQKNREKVLATKRKSTLKVFYEGPSNPKGELQWLKRAQAINRALKRTLKSSNPDLSLLLKLGLNL